MVEETQQFCTFRLDEFLFGIEVKNVQEVIRYLEMTTVPLAPPVIRGLINLRGQIVTAIDLRRRLEIKERPDHISPMNVVVRTQEGAVSLLVDSIGSVITPQKDTFEFPPETLKGVSRELIRGTYKLKEALLLVLDIDKALEVSALI